MSSRATPASPTLPALTVVAVMISDPDISSALVSNA
jgi:hypothetical protein